MQGWRRAPSPTCSAAIGASLPQTRRRVETSIRALKYHPHAGARSMRAGRTDVIALVVPISRWSNERVLMPYVYGVLESAREHGWNVMLLTGADGISEIDRVVRGKMVDGLVLMEVLSHDERVPFVAEPRPAGGSFGCAR